jgi:hypothetical protein
VPAPIAGGAGSQSAATDDGAMEIVLNGGRRVIVGKHADMAALRQVVTMLERL